METLHLIVAPIISLIMAVMATTSIQALPTKPENLIKLEATIHQVPSPKSAAFSPNGDELWVTSLMNISETRRRHYFARRWRGGSNF